MEIIMNNPIWKFLPSFTVRLLMNATFFDLKKSGKYNSKSYKERECECQQDASFQHLSH